MKNPTAALLIIGNEILSGRTAECNLHCLAQILTRGGVQLTEARVVRDEQSAIVDAINQLRARVDFVFTSGGIGPTHDDITTDSVAAAFGVTASVDPRAAECLRRFYAPRGEELTPSRIRMARLPKGATLIDNRISGAPGYRIGNVFVMAGVPAIFRAMAETVAPSLGGGMPSLSRSVRVYAGESVVAEFLFDLQSRYDDVEIGSYPGSEGGGGIGGGGDIRAEGGRFFCSLVFTSPDSSRVAAALGECENYLAENQIEHREE